MSAAIIADNTTTKIMAIGELSTTVPATSNLDTLGVSTGRKYKIERVLFNLNLGVGVSRRLRFKTTTGVYYDLVLLDPAALPVTTDTYKLEAITSSDGSGLMLTFLKPLILNENEQINFTNGLGSPWTRKITFVGEFTQNSP